MIYAVFGGLWILTSGWIVERIAGSSDALARLEQFKGYFFIIATAVLLYALVARLMRHIRLHERELEESAERERMRLQELDHRVKNAMGGLLAMIDLCRDEYTDTHAFAGAIRRRVQGMSDVHNLLAEGHWSSIDLHRLLAIMRPPDAPGRVTLEGPQVSVPPRQATALGMIVQELMSNALKHGALGNDQGTVRVSWQVHEPPGTERVLSLNWAERSERAVLIESKPGLGTRLIHGFAKSELRGNVELNYTPEGANHRLQMRLDHSDGTRS